jgi:hypothetical protein
MKKIFIVVFIIILSLSACAPKAESQPTPTPQPSDTHTLTPSTTYTRLPRLTATITSTPLSGGTLTEEGPWLMYEHGDGSIYLVNQDGSGRTALPYKRDAYVYDWLMSSSPYKLVSKIIRNESGRTDDELYIFSLPGMQVIQQFDLYAYHQTVEIDEMEWDEFINSASVWSPDGRYLAFPAIHDNASVDLYVYDAETNNIQRLTWGKNHVGEITWSPDSRWIIHEEVSSFLGWSVEAMWASAPDGSENKWLYSPMYHDNQEILGWLDDERFISIGHAIEGEHDIRVTDLRIGESILLYNGFFYPGYPIINFETESMIISSIDGLFASPFKPGLYLFNIENPAFIELDYNQYATSFTAEADYFYTSLECADEDNNPGFIGFKADMKEFCVHPIPFSWDEPSPDGNWALAIDQKICLYQTAGKCLFEFGPGFGRTIWRSDSQGFFMRSSNSLYYVDLDTLEPVLVDDKLGITGTEYRDTSPQWIGE